MKAPFSWLKEYVDIDLTAQELEGRLFSSGFEVEELIDLRGGMDRVVVGVVTEAVKQEGTHLHICKVDAGEYGHDIQISTGAPNVYVGMHTVAALDNSVLPGGMKIKAKKLMGIDSYGMLCSGEELGLNEDLYPGSEVYGLLDLPKDTVPGTDIGEVVGLNDYIFDISVTANRPDCQSILGIAREVAALLGKPLKMPATDYVETDYEFPGMAIDVAEADRDVCPRYLGHGVHNIVYKQSPRWMRRYLALCGLRSISAVVDITNFVMLEIGQPMHAFDYSMIKTGKVLVRRAKDGEKIQTLDGKEFTLKTNNLVITDGEEPIALAGVMGGLSSEITENTTELLFEAAKFARDSVRHTARGLGQNTDSSARYEKGVSEYTVELGMARALHLINELDCGQISKTSFDISAGAPREGKHFTATLSGINRILGIEVPEEAVLDILKRLNFEVEQNGDVLSVVAPRYREDIEIGEPDLAEEVIREYGYEHIVPTFLKEARVTGGGLNPDQNRRAKVKQLMCAEGFYEISTLAFYADADLDEMGFPADAEERQVIRLLNPITEKLAIMRRVLAPSVLRVVVDNLKKGNSEGRIFEFNKVFIPKQLPVTELPDEVQHIGFAAFGPEEDFFTVKGAVEALAKAFDLTVDYERCEDVAYLHPGIAAYILIDGKRVGYFGKLANKVAAGLKLPKDSKANLNIYMGEIDYAAFESHIVPFRYQPVSEFPSVTRDLALVVDEQLLCGDIVREIKKACKAVSDVELFDLYRNPAMTALGKKSMAFKITFQPGDAALSQDEINRYVNKIVGNLKYKLGAEMR